MCALLSFLAFLLIKATRQIKAENEIMFAIDAYAEETQDWAGALVMLGAMESPLNTLFRLWDWGCENILPKKYYELIKPYMEEK